MPSRRRRYRHRPKPQPRKPLANEEIKVPQVRLVGSDGSQLGVVPTSEALAKAREEESDLVMVAGKIDPPVVRIMDLGKHMYEKRKKQAKQKAKTKGKDVKGVRLGFKTDEHDWNMRLNQAARFLEEGHKVKAEMRLRGREKQRFDLAEERLKRFIGEIPNGAQQEGTIARSHNAITIVIMQPSKS